MPNISSFWKVIFLSISLFVYSKIPVFAMEATLEWDANSEANRAGYIIYYDTKSGPPYHGKGALEGDSPIKVKIIDVEAGDKARFTLTDLDGDKIYFFRVKCYNYTGMESGYSNEVSTRDNNEVPTRLNEIIPIINFLLF